jgi:serine/threonine-protein kinase
MFCPNDGTRLAGTAEMTPVPDDDPLVGTVLTDRYRVIRRVGEGGMGVVYEAEHVLIDKRVALKVLRDDYTKRPEVSARFRQEARSASRIGHENIVDVTDFGTTPQGGVFFVMEYLQGEDLADVLRRERLVTVERGIPIMIQVCRALAAAHAKGIIHRDLKPENIYLIEKNGRPDFVKILDFGIAKISEVDDGTGVEGRRLTKTGMIFGTPEYMSPEQAAGKPLDHRVDIYATGIILYEIFSGRVPFMGDTFMGVLTQHLFEAPPPMRTLNPNLKIPSSLEVVIFKALSKDAAKRHQSMQELLDDIEGAMKAPDAVPLVTQATPPTAPGVAVLPVPVRVDTLPDLETPRRSRLPAILIALGIVLGMGAAAAYLFGRGEGRSASADEHTVAAEPPASAEPSPRATSPDGSATGATAAPETAAPETTAPAEPERVQITVETDPAGASVSVEGRGEVCESTPCTFDHPRGEELSLRARHGRASATKTITPEETMTIELALTGGRSGGGHRGGGSKTGGGASSGGSAGDLKIPSIWQTGGH